MKIEIWQDGPDGYCFASRLECAPHVHVLAMATAPLGSVVCFHDDSPSRGLGDPRLVRNGKLIKRELDLVNNELRVVIDTHELSFGVKSPHDDGAEPHT